MRELGQIHLRGRAGNEADHLPRDEHNAQDAGLEGPRKQVLHDGWCLVDQAVRDIGHLKRERLSGQRLPLIGVQLQTPLSDPRVRNEKERNGPDVTECIERGRPWGSDDSPMPGQAPANLILPTTAPYSGDSITLESFPSDEEALSSLRSEGAKPSS